MGTMVKPVLQDYWGPKVLRVREHEEVRPSKQRPCSIMIAVSTKG